MKNPVYSVGVDCGEKKLKNCLQCGKQFLVWNAEIRKGGGKYCSRVCYSKSKEGAGNHRYKPDKGWISCRHCKNLFRVSPSSVGSNKSKVFCSAKCRKQVIGTASVVCKECGSIFTVNLFRLNRRDSKPTFCSRHCMASYQSHSPITTNGRFRGGKTRGGKRTDLNDLYVRSSWEANYARYLNWLVAKKQILRWEYEPDTFEFTAIKRGSKFYTPDFKVFELSGEAIYHEVKGWMNAESKTKLRRMSKYFPDVKIIVIDKKAYTILQKQCKNLVPFWE